MYTVPERIRYQGKEYPVNADIQSVMTIYDWLENGDLDDIDQAVMLVTIMFGSNAPVVQALVDEATEILRLGKEVEEQLKQETYLDLKYDYETIRMDFVREYGVDIKEQKVSYDFVMSGIANLSDKSSTSTLVKIRRAKLSDYKDPKQKREIAELKKQVALPVSKIEQNAIENYDNDRVSNIFNKLLED